MSRQLRLFTAILPTRQEQQAVAALRRDWVRPQQQLRPQVERLHLTLQFVANWPAARLADWQQALAALHFEPFDIVLDRREHWQTPGGELLVLLPRPCFALAALYSATKTLARNAGVPGETRTWRPHVTALRGGMLPAGPLRVQPVRWRVDSVALVRSEPSGYRVLRRFHAAPDAQARTQTGGPSR